MNEHEKLQFFYEMFHSSLLRLGPGTEGATMRALRAVLAASPSDRRTTANAWPRILDLGCGTGSQTLVLAKHLDGEILAIDNHQPYLDTARRRAEAEGVANKISFRLEDMRTVKFDNGSFDVIWSEGAIYCMGFRGGLDKCQQWLVPGGFLALTELCWLKANPSPECWSFLNSEYPAITDIDGNLAEIKARGYTVLDHFVLPKSAWTEEYYKPIEERLKTLRGRYVGDSERLGMIESIQTEIDVYRKYSDDYGYVFYVLRC